MALRRRLHSARRTLFIAPYLPYAMYLGAVGIVALASQDRGIIPDTLTDTIPWWLATMWTLAVAAGGVLATIGALWRHTRIESAGLALLAFGAALYGACITAAAWPTGATALAVVAAVVSSCLLRMRVLTLARRAQEEAQDIADEQAGEPQ